MAKGFGDWRLCYIESAAVSDVKFLEAMWSHSYCSNTAADIAVTILILSSTMISNENGKQLTMTNIGPLNIYLPDKLEFKIDGKSALKAPFDTCNEAGCCSQQILEQTAIDALRKGKIA